MQRQVLEKALLLRELLLDRTTRCDRGDHRQRLGYLILPVDLVPDLLSDAGFVDNIAARGLVLANLDQWVTGGIRERARHRLPANLKTLKGGEKD